MRPNRWCVLLVVILELAFCKACSVNDVEINKWVDENKIEKIEPTLTGDIRSWYTNKVEEAKFQDGKYLHADLNEDNLTISLTDDEYNGNAYPIVDTLLIKCAGGDKWVSLQFRQLEKTTNNDGPKFGQDTYKFVFYTQLEEGFELTNAMAIYAVGSDSPELQFTIDPKDDLEIAKFGSDFEAVLKTKQKLSPPFEKTFTITASDDTGNGTAMIYLELVDALDLSFEKSEYTAYIKGERIELTAPMKLKDGMDKDVILTIDAEHSNAVEANIDFPSNSIRLKQKEAIGEDFKGPITLKAFWKGKTSETTIKIEEERYAVCGIENYNPTTTVKGQIIPDDHMGNIMTLTGVKGAQEIKCDGSKYVKCKGNADKLVFYTSEEFYYYEENENDDVIYISINIKCFNGDYFTIPYTQEIDFTNNHVPEFKSRSYNAIFYGEIPKDTDISEFVDIEAVDLDVGEKSVRFDIEEISENSSSDKESKAETFARDLGDVDLIDKSATIKLPVSDTLTAPFNKSFRLTVADPEDVKSKSGVVLNVNVYPLEFEYHYYTGRFKTNFITFDVPIQLVCDLDEEMQFVIQEDIYSTYLQPVPNFLTNTVEYKVIGNMYQMTQNTISTTLVMKKGGIRTQTKVDVKIRTTILWYSTENVDVYFNWIFFSALGQIICGIIAISTLGFLIVYVRSRFLKK